MILKNPGEKFTKVAFKVELKKICRKHRPAVDKMTFSSKSDFHLQNQYIGSSEFSEPKNQNFLSAHVDGSQKK